MVHLLPTFRHSFENASGADGQRYFLFALLQSPAFASHPRFMPPKGLSIDTSADWREFWLIAWRSLPLKAA